MLINSFSVCYSQELDLSDISETDVDNEYEAEDDAVYDLQSIVIHKGEYGSGASNQQLLLLIFCYPCNFLNMFLSLNVIQPYVLSGHYYSYVRPDIRQNDWYRFDDEFVTRVDYSDVIADAYGGSRRIRRKRRRSDSLERGTEYAPVKRQRGIFQRIFSFLGLFRRVAMIGSNSSAGGGGCGYGGRTSNAYMIQYARRSHIPKLYLEEDQ